ncbi:hypothetical protein KP509_27G054800 [Ceratopteris richardii]|uniref:4Fe-4S ferredoxin-type domain-containing protein n=1 Tax=Ceratopteris richardii TaxID=49495 RepID=A0A8T2RI01_CERRI|nr:hypothetical protein KP509_27G054800 [Ceratopteris richardii]
MITTIIKFKNYGQQVVEAAKYIGQGFTVTSDHPNRLPTTVQYPYEKNLPSERFRGRIHFEFDKCIACEVCKRIIKKKKLRSYSIDFGVCIFCGNCIEYCPTNCLSMTEEYELSSYDRHELNYDQTSLGRVPVSVLHDVSVQSVRI